MISNVHVCSFSGGVAYLKPREQRDTQKVLKALKSDPMVSTWDMGEHGLWKTIYALVDAGYLKEIKQDYPWLKFIVTESGIEKCNESNV